MGEDFHNLSFHIAQGLWKAKITVLQPGIDVCGNIANIVLQGSIALA